MPTSDIRRKREQVDALKERLIYHRVRGHRAVKLRRAYERGKAELARMRRSARSGKASAHLSMRAFDCHDKTRVPRAAEPAVRKLCSKLIEPMCAKFGAVTVNSGYRTRTYNHKIGGASASQHIYDDSPGSVAADLTFVRGEPEQWAAEARRLGAGGVGTYTKSNFVHLDNGPRRDWWG